ncbi:hypothetical protein AA313_de0200455 [Arthrobotrys entomopaga]|nr:hypothetical protein AA313_de0200455 [Arthrobotrys entomopaga]
MSYVTTGGSGAACVKYPVSCKGNWGWDWWAVPGKFGVDSFMGVSIGPVRREECPMLRYSVFKGTPIAGASETWSCEGGGGGNGISGGLGLCATTGKGWIK